MTATSPGEDAESYVLLEHIVVLLLTVGVGVWVSGWLSRAGLTLPAYIGAMLVAALVRNLDDVTKRPRHVRRLRGCPDSSITSTVQRRW